MADFAAYYAADAAIRYAMPRADAARRC